MTRRDEIQRLRSAALEGSVDAQYDLACAYAEGDGVPRSQSTAYRWFEKAAGQGDAESMTAAGYCLLNGDGVEEARTAFPHHTTTLPQYATCAYATPLVEAKAVEDDLGGQRRQVDTTPRVSAN